MSSRRFAQVDVFGGGPLGGNPVAVVLDGDGLSDEEMQRFANWTNLSEAAFVLPPTTPAADYRVRIFTTAEELPFAGHPTLGACHAWLGGREPPTRLVQETAAGLIKICATQNGLGFAAPPLVRSGPVDADLLARIKRALGIDDVVDAQWVDNGPGWVAVLLEDAESVLALQPGDLEGLFIGAAGLHPGGDLEVRGFFTGGEDPVTGPTGTFGHGLMPLLQADPRVSKVIGIARRPFDPAEKGWAKLEYRQGDVRDPAALEEAFRGADVVVHLAFMITGTASRETTRAINVDGTLNAFRAAAQAGARRFVYASSVAAYGFHPDNPVPMDESWPTRPAKRLFYAQEKAEIEALLAEEAAGHPGLDLYLLRPPIVLGPNAVGAKEILPGPLGPLAGALVGTLLRSPLPLPAAAPDHPLQLIHEDDVRPAFLECVVGAGPPGAYNLAADDTVTAVDVARAAGLAAVTVPGGLVRGAARAVSSLPFLPPQAEWIEAAAHPSIMDTSKAKRELGWTPRHGALDALRATLDAG